MKVSNHFISVFHNPKEHVRFTKILVWNSFQSFILICYLILELFNINLQYPTETPYHTGVAV